MPEAFIASFSLAVIKKLNSKAQSLKSGCENGKLYFKCNCLGETILIPSRLFY
jgi:hypothetical protein